MARSVPILLIPILLIGINITPDCRCVSRFQNIFSRGFLYLLLSATLLVRTRALGNFVLYTDRLQFFVQSSQSDFLLISPDLRDLGWWLSYPWMVCTGVYCWGQVCERLLILPLNSSLSILHKYSPLGVIHVCWLTFNLVANQKRVEKNSKLRKQQCI